MKRTFGFIALIAFFSIGCGSVALAAQPLATSVVAPTWTFSPLPSPIETVSPAPTLIPSGSATVSPPATVTLTETSSPSPEPQYVHQGPGKILAPILLYHQIGYSKISNNPYYVAPEDFEKQMYLLYAWGYRTITVEQLANAILNGADLPFKPVVLTFDDGNENAYSTVLPVLQKYNFVGTAYIVYNYVGAINYMTKDQIRALHEAGWEIGSHSLSHRDLRLNPDRQEREIIESKQKLETLLGFPIVTFAYPFGTYDELSLFYIHQSRYVAAVGLGPDMHQGPDNIFYLYRRDIKGSYDLKTFAQFLPWQGDINNLPAVTAVP